MIRLFHFLHIVVIYILIDTIVSLRMSVRSSLHLLTIILCMFGNLADLLIDVLSAFHNWSIKCAQNLINFKLHV